MINSRNLIYTNILDLTLSNDDPKSIIFIEYLFPIPPSQSQSQT